MTPSPKYKLTGTAIAIFFFGTIPAILLGILTWYSYPNPVWMFTSGFGALWFIGCTVGFIKELKVNPRDIQEAENVKMLQATVTDMGGLAYESHVILGAEDKRALDRSFLRPLPALFVIFLIPAVISVFTSPFVLLICLVPVGLAIASWWTISVMKKRNRKVILRGIVTDRSSFRSRKNDRDTTYYLHIGDRKVRVEADLYETYIVGEIIELHYVGWLSGGKMKITGSVFTQHKKLTPEKFIEWKKDNLPSPGLD